MFVKGFMTRSLVLANTEEKAGVVLQRMREHGVRRMPVLDAEGRLAGIISDRRLLQALAVPVRRGEARAVADIHIPLVVGEIMNRNVATTSPDMPLELAATLMASKRIGSLVVMEDDSPVGIITETDMFRVFLRLLIGQEKGLRVTVRAPAFGAILADLTTGVARAGGNLLSLGTITDEEGLMIAFKVADMNRQDLSDVLDELPIDVLDIREM